MENCPDKETLEKFVDYGLTEEMNKKILSHLSMCCNCREKVHCLMVKEQSLLTALFDEPVSHEHAIITVIGSCLSKAALFAYSDKLLKEDQLKLVESHLEKCDNCMFELLKVQRLMNAPADLDLDMSALKAMEAFHKGYSILEIVLKAKDNLLELIRHNGELLSLTPQFDAIRGEEEKEERPIIIRKDFHERDLSVEVKIKRDINESGATVNVSIMTLSSEQFLSGIDVELSGLEMQQKRNTQDGFAEFYGLKSGTYGIKVSGDETAQITIE